MQVTSTDLTKMYLGRLKRYGDPLHCVVTPSSTLRQTPGGAVARVAVDAAA